MVTVRTSDLVQQICRDIRAGADMDSIARAQSVDSYRTQGGLQKSKYGIDLELTLRNLADTLPVGTVSDPFPYRSVYAVARIERKIPADAGEFDSLKSGIESQLKRLEYSSQWELFLTGLKDRFGYALDSAALTAIRADSADLYTPDFTIGTDNVVIRLGEKTRVTDAELRKKIGRAAMTGGGMPFVELLERTVAEITQDLVLTAVAYDDGYDELPAVRKEYNRTLDSALVETYLEEIVAPRIVFRRAEFETYYQEHLQDFKRPDRLRFDRLVVDSEAVALEIFERLADGADFRYVSEQYDLDASSAEESAEWLPITSFPDHLRADIDQLRIGACLPPQRIDKGWLILRLKARQPGEVMGIEEVEPRIRSTLFQQKFDAELDSVLLLLKENSDIEYNDEAIEEYFGDGS